MLRVNCAAIGFARALHCRKAVSETKLWFHQPTGLFNQTLELDLYFDVCNILLVSKLIAFRICF
ncbi:unnamed protein product [Citrullus colocynthis]|uniref:Uncharacterized protein n=1 Tax=Citrullus colocynthis TaxID=252529 RepID=A0ABP0YIP2_9ROSI